MLSVDVILREGARLCLAAALFGCLQAGAGVVAMARLRRRTARAVQDRAARGSDDLPPVTMLKPLHGDEPLLRVALDSMATQDYPDYQIVLGVQDPADPAIAVARAVIQAHPYRDIELAIVPTPHPGNGKVGNLINMLPSARHDVLVVSDSDIHAGPDYLRAVVGALEQPGTGLATTVYLGQPATTALPERLAAAQLNHNFLPGNLLARWLGRQDCLGATMAFSRETLARVGGFASLLGHVADDGEMGQRVRALGLGVALAPTIVSTTAADATFPELVAHELRWGRTVRTQEPVGYALSVLQLPLAWATASVLLAPTHPGFWSWFLVIWLVRWATTRTSDHLAGAPRTIWWWELPLRDWLSAYVMAGSFLSRRVTWRGQTFHITSHERHDVPRQRQSADCEMTDRNKRVRPLVTGLPPGSPAVTTQPTSAVEPNGSLGKTPV